VGELHLWNERIPRPLGSPGSLATATNLRTQIVKSFSNWSIEPEMQKVTAFHARICRVVRAPHRKLDSLSESRGFTIFRLRPSLPGKLHDFLELFLIQALTWVFNPERRCLWGCNFERIDI
jgi:hypothetical protein